MSEKLKKKKRLDSPEPTAVIRELMAQPGIKKIRVFKNGDAYHQGVQMVINDRQVHDLSIFLAAVTNRIDLPFGAKKLYTINGTQVKDIRQIQDGKDYVASSGLFTPQIYGGVVHRTSRAKSVEPERKKKKKKKRAASVTPAKHAEEQSEGKEIENPLKHPKKKAKKVKKKKEHKINDHYVEKAEKQEEKEEEEVNHGEVRSVSRYAHIRSPTRAESRMHWKDTSIDEDDKTVHENDHDKPIGHGEHGSDNDSEKEGILPSEIHFPYRNETSHGIENLHIDEVKHKVDEKLQEADESATEVKNKIEKEVKNSTKAVSEAVDKRKKSVYHWGDLNTFTKNIESLLKRKE